MASADIRPFTTTTACSVSVCPIQRAQWLAPIPEGMVSPGGDDVHLRESFRRPEWFVNEFRPLLLSVREFGVTAHR